jgi:hypothetical protein
MNNRAGFVPARLLALIGRPERCGEGKLAVELGLPEIKTQITHNAANPRSGLMQ